MLSALCRLIVAEVADEEIYLRMWNSLMTMAQNVTLM
jgi:hypothetical protein